MASFATSSKIPNFQKQFTEVSGKETLFEGWIRVASLLKIVFNRTREVLKEELQK